MKKINFFKKLKMIDKKFVRNYFVTLIFVSFFATVITVYYEKSYSEGVFQKEMDGYTRLLEKFINQDWSIIALKNNASGTLTKELNYFVNKNSECLKFYYSGKEVGNFGNCILAETKIDSNDYGWFSSASTLLLREKYRMGVSMDLTIDNPEHFYIENGAIKTPYLLRHVYSSLKNIVFIILLFSFGCFIFFLFQKIKEQLESSKEELESSKDKVHDFTNLTEDDSSLVDEIEFCSHDPEAMKGIANRMRFAIALKEAVLYDGAANRVFSYRLGDLLNEFCLGFFFNKDKSVLVVNPFNEGIYISTDKRLFLRVLSNLFDNALIAVSGKEIFRLTVLESPDKIDFVVSNKGTIASPNKVFQPGFSNRGSSGRGLAIVDEMISRLGSEIFLTQGVDEVSFSFSLPIAKEKSWPALYA